ncbi:hypothetical protein NW768_002263 [Fusarium equiseti]|uniref:C2H2-type domain-containing protein n=1 Tax=Fusarium equiseti TaxID=61235 RepID=A0ABQ8RN09_FUSEQ|nr:hypothetical protein NW768_002263 [Fusarium equiseti]
MEFMRRREWMLHEVQNHWKKYPCPCACGAIFPAKILCQEHVNEIHCDAFPKDQVGSMIDLSSKPIKLEDGTFCPFCREPLHSAKEYQRHAGRHQEQLALFALPQLEGGGDEAQSENGTSRENSSNPSEGFHTERLEIQIVNGSLADDEAPPKSPQDNTDDGHFGTFVRPRQELPEGPGAVSKDALPHEGQEERDAPSGEGWTKISRQVFDAEVLKLREAMGIDESSDIEGGVIMSPRKLTPTEIDRYVTAMRALQEKRRRDEDAISDGICPAWMQSKIFEDLPIPSPTTEDPRISQDNTRIGKETESSEGEVSEEQGEMRVSPKRPEELNQDEATSFTDDLRPTSGDSVLVAYLDNGRDPEIARAAGRESLPVDEDSDYSQYSGVSDRKDKAAALLQAHPMRRKEKDREGEEPGWALNQPKEGSRVAPIKVDKDNNDASSEAQKRAQRKSEFERSIESHPLLKEIEDTW